MKCNKIIYAAIINLTATFTLIFSSNAIAIKPDLKCVQVPEFQVELNKVDEAYRTQSKDYLVYKTSSSGWVMEAYLFIGKIDNKYIISLMGFGIPIKKVEITKSEFEELFNTAMKSFNGKKLSTSSSEHEVCIQLIVKSSTINDNVIVSGMPNDVRLRPFDKLLLKMVD